MFMKGKVKEKTVDKYLAPIRQQIVNLIKPNTKVIDYGCGNGDLLLQLSTKIKTGIGFDHSSKLISFAREKAISKECANLKFETKDLTKIDFSRMHSDYGVISLLLHIISSQEAKDLLINSINSSETTLICGFSQPKNSKQRFLLWLDQRFNSHFSNYKVYAKNGFTEGLLQSIENLNYSTFDTFDPVIKIYKIENQKN